MSGKSMKAFNLFKLSGSSGEIMTNEFITSDLIQQIRDYQAQNRVLKEQSHHFVFDCPFDANAIEKPKYIWIGLNPGDDTDDWAKTNNKNSEETRDFNFQEKYGRGSRSQKRMDKVKKFLGEEFFSFTTHTELFFWGSKDTSKDFTSRYGTSFNDNPHMQFCCELNRQLIDRIEPKAIFFESISKIDLLRKHFPIQLQHQERVGPRPVDTYLLDGKYKLINFDHLSALGDAIKYRPEVSKLVRSFL